MSEGSSDAGEITGEAGPNDARRQRPAFSRADLSALVSGTVLVLFMLVWFSWRMAEIVSRDRDVDARSSAPIHAH